MSVAWRNREFPFRLKKGAESKPKLIFEPLSPRETLGDMEVLVSMGMTSEASRQLLYDDCLILLRGVGVLGARRTASAS